MMRLALWAGGFLLLFLINLLAEAIVLPHFGLHGPKNDFYFISWWCAVILWLLFGYFVTGSKDSEEG